VIDLAHDLQARLDELRQKHGVPGAGVAVRHGHEEAAAFSGVSSLDRAEPIGEHTLFELGSISKSYTATALMALVAAERLALDEPVVTYLPDLKLGEQARRSLTLRHLLNHTSGLDGDHIVDTGDDAQALERYAATLGDVAQVTGVGAVFSYNNTAYVLAGHLLEQTSGLHWRAAIQQLLIDPLGLHDTFTSAAEAPAGRLATGHVQREGVLAVAPASGIPRSLEPAGGVCASARDVLAFADVHLGRRDLLPTELRQMMSASSVSVADPSVGVAWGLGLSVARSADPRVIGHDGGTIGHVASLRILPELGIAVAAAVNSSSGGGLLMRELIDGLLQELGDVPPSPAVEPLPNGSGSNWPLGTYIREGFRIDVLADGPGAKVVVALNELASSALGTSRLEGDLRATEASDVFVSNLFDPQEWTPLVVSQQDEQRYLHLNGRAHSMVSA
jgi:CubicO group peptidase (beta-lactamase class C family)